MKGRNMKTKTKFGKDWTEGSLTFPKHLTPEIIHSALFVYNAEDKDAVAKRVQYCAKQIGDEAMSYAMALLVLPELQKMTMQSDEYKSWQQSRTKTLN
jgi:hypothetical protein|tara:strand:- start:141 stop:434 length:294 start_codon:yes stop_codon:yes gene_type:complete